MNILTDLILESRSYLSSNIIFGISMGRNKSFFSLLGLWETFLSLGDSADALGGFAKLRGCFGRFWEALGMLWEALGWLSWLS